MNRNILRQMLREFVLLVWFVHFSSAFDCKGGAQTPLRTAQFVESCCADGGYDQRHVCRQRVEINMTHAVRSPQQEDTREAILQAIRNRRIAFLGDSLSFEMFITADCSFNKQALGMQVDFVPMYTIPLRPSEVRAALRDVVSNYDIIVLHFGIWYNWSPSSDLAERNIGAYTSDYSRRMWVGLGRICFRRYSYSKNE